MIQNLKFKTLFMRFWPKIISVSALLVFLPMSVAYSTSPPSTGSYIPSVTDIASMMKSMLTNMPVLVQFTVAFAYVVGVSLVFSAVNELRIYGQARTMMALNTSFTGPLSRLVAGIALLFFPGIINVSIYSLWGYGAQDASVLAFDTTGNNSWDAIISGVVALVQVMGYAAMIRGFMLLSRMGRQGGQPGMFGKALMHILGGILAVNIVATTKVLEATFGFNN